jgi:hypothetical protein
VNCIVTWSSTFTGLPLHRFGAGIVDPSWRFITWSCWGDQLVDAVESTPGGQESPPAGRTESPPGHLVESLGEGAA